MTPIYLSKVYELKEEDSETWEFLRNNFCCRKTFKAFASIDVDHCLEQTNRDLKEVGGIVGLQDHLLDRYCIISPINRQLVDQFLSTFFSKPDSRSMKHHETNKGETKFHNNAVTLYFDRVSWKHIFIVFNVMTHSVLEQDEYLLNCEESGSSLLEKLVSLIKLVSSTALPKLKPWLCSLIVQ
jgi:hypothetical protein